MKKIIIFGLLLFIISAAPCLYADDFDALLSLPENRLEISYATDSEQSQIFQAYSEFTLAGFSLLSLSYSESELQLEQNELDTTSYSISLDSDNLQTFSVGGDYQYNESKQALRIQSVRFRAHYNHRYFALELAPEIGAIDYLIRPELGTRIEELAAHRSGLGIQLPLYPISRLSISASRIEYHYNNDPRDTVRIGLINRLFTLETLLQIAGFEQEKNSLDIGFSFHNQYLSVNWSNSISALTEDTLNSYSLLYQVPINQHWIVTPSYGQTDNAVDWFASLALQYAW